MVTVFAGLLLPSVCNGKLRSVCDTGEQFLVGRMSGESGACVKSKASSKSFAAASRSVRGWNPNRASINLTSDENSYCVCEMYPGFAYGEIISNGTRGPRPNWSIWGGATWSYQPPQSSQVTKIAVVAQSGLCIMALICCTVQFSPSQELLMAGPACSL